MDGLECVDHVLVGCPYATMICDKICTVHGVGELVDYVARWGGCLKKKKQEVNCYMYELMWTLWKTINERLFQANSSTPSKVVENVKSLVYLWIKVKGKGVICN